MTDYNIYFMLILYGHTMLTTKFLKCDSLDDADYIQGCRYGFWAP